MISTIRVAPLSLPLTAPLQTAEGSREEIKYLKAQLKHYFQVFIEYYCQQSPRVVLVSGDVRSRTGDNEEKEGRRFQDQWGESSITSPLPGNLPQPHSDTLCSH